MPNVQILNTDLRPSGLNALGSDERITKVFNFPPLTAQSWSTINETFDNLGKIQKVNKQYQVSGTTIKNPIDQFVLKKPYNLLDALVIDTVDGVYWSIKASLLNGRVKANKDDWDQMLNMSMKLFRKIGSMDVIVIANCHERSSDKGDITVVKPFLQGSFKDQIGDYFDIILYSHTYHSKEVPCFE